MDKTEKTEINITKSKDGTEIMVNGSAAEIIMLLSKTIDLLSNKINCDSEELCVQIKDTVASLKISRSISEKINSGELNAAGGIALFSTYLSRKAKSNNEMEKGASIDGD